MSLSVSGLWRYPVKSFLGEAVSTVEVGTPGVVGDRAYAVQDVEDGTVASAKNPRKWGRLLTLGARYLEEPSAGDDAPPPVLITLPDGTTTRSDQDSDTVLSRFLDRPVRLLDEKPPGAHYEYLHPRLRKSGPPGEFDVDEGQLVGMAGSRVPSFVDLSPLHVLTTSSLRRVAELGDHDTVAPERFRPNVLLGSEGSSFVEQDWPGRSSLTLGTVSTRPTMATPRCLMITLQHGDLAGDRTPFKTIGRENTTGLGTPALDEQYGRLACLGVYAAVTDGGRLEPPWM